ncbi:MAG: radical SAM protein [Planctomycetota bacterium]
MSAPAVHTKSLNRDLRIDDVIAGKHRLDLPETIRLFREADIHDLGIWSSAVCDRIHGSAPSPRTYVIDRNINYTNVCSANCTFCAFKRDLGDEDSYVLDTATLNQKIQELVDIGGTQILLQGGMHPELDLAWYVDMLRKMKTAFPQVHIHGFSPPEIVEFVAVLEIEGYPTPGVRRSHELPEDVWLAKCEAILTELRDAGLDSLPGGGGEIFAEHVRSRIGLGKATARQWLDVMTVGHKLGLNTSATMMFGHLEGFADRAHHMLTVRDRQDLALERGYAGKTMAFISWPYQRENTPLGRLSDWDAELSDDFHGDLAAEAVHLKSVDPTDKRAIASAAPRYGKSLRMAGAHMYLRTQAISRLVLDNVHSIGSSWVTMGPHIGQLALKFGANDMGSVMMEENVVSAAGTTYQLNEAVLCRLIRDAGHVPAQRNNRYELLNVHEDLVTSPDGRVDDWSTQRAGKVSPDSDAQPGDEGRNGAVPLTIHGSEDTD